MNRTIVIIHPGALGDVLLAVPAMRGLRERFPHHQHVLCAHRSVARLLFECRVVDDWISMQGSACAHLFEPGASIEGELKGWLAHCDCAVAWMQDKDGSLAVAWRKAGARNVMIASPFSTGVKATHQSDRFCEIAEVLPAPRSSFKPIQIPEEMRLQGRVCLGEVAIGFDRPLVTVHPGSGSAQKSVAIATMAMVTTKFKRQGFTPVVIEGPADREAVCHFLSEMPFPVAVVRDLELPTLAGVLSHARLFIGHDSGVTHLAALQALPVLVFFGPTDPDRWAPLGSHVTVIKNAPSSVYFMTPGSDVFADRCSTTRPYS